MVSTTHERAVSGRDGTSQGYLNRSGDGYGAGCSNSLARHLSDRYAPPARSTVTRVRLPQKCRRAAHQVGVRGESLGVRSTVVGLHVVGVQTVEEFPDRPPGSEHVKGDMLPVLRNDLVFALRF
jgi:hypothetical protein